MGVRPVPLARFQDWFGRFILDPLVASSPDRFAYRTITDDGFSSAGLTASPGVGRTYPRPATLSPGKGILGLGGQR